MINHKDNFLVGIGFDRHYIKKSRKPGVFVCNKLINIRYKSIAHSDGDVVLHSLSDAILGAIGKRDIGHYFPNTSATTKNIDSAEIISFAVNNCQELGYSVNNVDIVLISNHVNVQSNYEDFIENISKLTNCDKVNIKGKT
jgi:2-C-methyl-D-erythritol 2,4-cyclodiphosphate synthase